MANSEAPVLYLPVELTLEIFNLCDSDVKERLTLAAICRDWRSIALQTGSLWTEVCIQMDILDLDTMFKRKMALLKMQFDRAAGHLLRVTWNSTGEFMQRRRELINLIREKGPFSQWRTLILRWHAIDDDLYEGAIQPNDVFTNLESVHVYGESCDILIHAIVNTATSKLYKIDLRIARIPTGTAFELFSGALGRISTLMLGRYGTTQRNTPQIPSNIQYLHVVEAHSHFYPHVVTLNMKRCTFHHKSRLDLGSLTSLTVTSQLTFKSGCIVILPVLQHLTCFFIDFSGTIFQAPVLETLWIQPYLDQPDEVLKTGIRNLELSLIHPDFHLSPKVSIKVGLSLSESSLTALLEKCPNVKSILLTFDEEKWAFSMVDRLFPKLVQEDEQTITGASGELCPQLSELNLDFMWGISDVEGWIDRSISAVNSRRRGEMTPLIYASWKGEGTYRCLTRL